MKQTKGYIIADGRFYETKEEATYEEEKRNVLELMATSIRLSSINLALEEYLLFVEDCPEEIAKFCVAKSEWLAFQSIKPLEQQEIEKQQEGIVI